MASQFCHAERNVAERLTCMLQVHVLVQIFRNDVQEEPRSPGGGHTAALLFKHLLPNLDMLSEVRFLVGLRELLKL